MIMMIIIIIIIIIIAKEKIVGWYHTGPKLCQSDVTINELMRRYCPNSVSVRHYVSIVTFVYSELSNTKFWIIVNIFNALKFFFKINSAYSTHIFNVSWCPL